jgi:tetratricopeptide (TPR) repeat protein/DNA-binding winged helix-turn-helix (wHTH) protein
MGLALSPSTLHFLDVIIDIETETIFRAGEERRLRQKSFQVLLYLLEHRDRVVTREELFDAIWPDIVVTEDTLVQCIVEIRKVLGDNPRQPRFVRTVPKRGYRFMALEDDRGPEDASPLVREVETSGPPALDGLGQSSMATAAAVHAPPRRNLFALAIAVLAVSVVLIAGAGTPRRETAPAGPDLRPAGRSVFEGLTTNPEAYRLYSLGLERANDLRTAEAIALFEGATRLDPGFAMAYARIGYSLGVTGGDAERARPFLARAAGMVSRLGERERIVVAGWQTIVAGDWNAAIEQFRMIIDRYPTDLESHLRLAQLLTGEERTSEGVAVLERALLIDPSSPGVQNSLGGLYSLLGRHEQAIAAHRRYVALRPAEPNAYDSLGISYSWSGDYDAALAQYARALELKPDFDLVRYHRAATYVQLGRFREAIADVRTLAGSPKSVRDAGRAWSVMAEIYQIAGDLPRAREAARHVPAESGWSAMLVGADPAAQSVEARQRRMAAFNGRGARMVRRGDFYFRGRTALARGERDAAIAMLRDSLRFKPFNWNVDSYETGLADAYLELGRFSEAAAEYSRVLSINPHYARAIYGRARAHEALGNRARAREDYERFLSLWKHADAGAHDALEARARLVRLG